MFSRFQILRMWVVLLAKLFQLYDTCFVPYAPGDDLSGMFPVVCFDDRPTAMRAIVASPFKMMKIARCVNFPDDRIAITGIM